MNGRESQPLASEIHLLSSTECVNVCFPASYLPLAELRTVKKRTRPIHKFRAWDTWQTQQLWPFLDLKSSLSAYHLGVRCSRPEETGSDLIPEREGIRLDKCHSPNNRCCPNVSELENGGGGGLPLRKAQKRSITASPGIGMLTVAD
jgi:hypothetical protein